MAPTAHPVRRSLPSHVASVHFQLAGYRGESPVHGLLNAVIIAACVVVQEHGFGQQHQQHGDEQTASQPSTGDPASHGVLLLSNDLELSPLRSNHISGNIIFIFVN